MEERHCFTKTVIRSTDFLSPHSFGVWTTPHLANDSKISFFFSSNIKGDCLEKGKIFPTTTASRLQSATPEAPPSPD
jgi:hypothetical protein